MAKPDCNWSDKQVVQHETAAKLLVKIMHECFDLMRHTPEISEYDVQKYILKKYKEYGMVSDKDTPIVAFRENTAFVHYFPKKSSAKNLSNDSLVMIDIWARLDETDAPYADITWMAWKGNEMPAEIKKAFDIVIKSRDIGMEFIRDKLAQGIEIVNKELGLATEEITLSSDIQEFIPHAYGHSLGTTSCHGNLGVIHGKSGTMLLDKVGYTMEPGIYIEGRYGFRSEIDFYVTNGKLVITTDVQNEIVRI